MKFGAEFRTIRFPFFQVPFPHGEMYFNNQATAYPTPATAVPGKPATPWRPSCSATSIGARCPPITSSLPRSWAYACYAQDDWKVTPKLTVSFGLRYELFSPISEKFGRQSNFDFQTMTLYIPKGKDQNTPLPPGFATNFPQRPCFRRTGLQVPDSMG